MRGVVSEQLQGQRRVLDVAVRQQKQVSDAAGRRQQAECSQGPPQLSAAPYSRAALREENSSELFLEQTEPEKGKEEASAALMESGEITNAGTKK